VIGTDHLPVLFGVELAGEACGVHEVTEEDGELPTFSVRRSRANWCGLALRRRAIQCGGQWHWRGGWRCAGRPTRPDEHPPVLLHRDAAHLDEFGFQIVEVVVIERKLALEGPI
jgi:hypothetical protein